MARKVIITCAVTGGIHTPAMSPHLPVTADEITRASVEAAEAGAAVIHLHARDPQTGRPDQSPHLFMDFLPRIKQQTGAILNITTGGGLGMTLDQRLAPALAAEPELASMNMGSFNFNISGESFGEQKGKGFNASILEKIARETGGSTNPELSTLTAEKAGSSTHLEWLFLLIALTCLALEIYLREMKRILFR